MSKAGFSQKQVEAATRLYDECKSWKAGDNLLYAFCCDYPMQDDAPINQIKVTLINRLYSAGILAERKMAEHISQINELTTLILLGDHSAVAKIGKTEFTPDNFRSFSSKYCHFHNPSKYPIYDKYTRIALGLPEPNPKDDAWYEQYCNQVSAAISMTGNSYDFAVMDRFLWLKGLKMERTANQNTPLSAGIEKIMIEYPDIWAQLG